MSTPSAPPWPYCAHGADPATDPIGCRGIYVPGHTECLAHLAESDRDSYLGSLTPGAAINHSGTTFTKELLIALLDTLRDPTTGHLHFGDTRFDRAQFTGESLFDRARFTGKALFRERFQRCLSRVRTAATIDVMRLGLTRDRRKMRQDFSRAIPRSTGARAWASARPHMPRVR